MKHRNFTCIICPNGCNIEAAIADDGQIEVSGNKCPRGREYVLQELTDPRRTISSTVRIEGAMLPLCSVRLDRPVPKKEIFKVMAEINKVTIQAPSHIGDVVIENVCGLDANVIVTKNLDKI